jgi:hypothetical protein
MLNGEVVEFISLEDKFNALADAWDDHNLGSPKIDYRSLSVLQIIGMGPNVIPFLIKRLESGETRWIFALKCITGEEAESPDMRGDANQVIDSWSNWWKRQ